MPEKTVAAGLNLSKNATTVLTKRYLKRDNQGKPTETAADMFRRVADTIDAAEPTIKGKKKQSYADDYYRMMTALDFLPNSPTLMNAGRELGQLSACFVLPVEDSMESIFEAIKNTALIHKSGGGTGFSFSRIRPANDEVRSTSGVSSGPLSFMRVFDAATETIKQGGTRRGANMGIMRVDHPDIMDFIMAKRDQTVLTNFNISVGMTEAFMQAVEKDQDYSIINPRDGKKVKKLSARKVFDNIVDMAWANGEPGIIFLDRLNRDNPTPQIGEIESTNPCGEQPLLPYESCNLGSINLANMFKQGDIDWQKLENTTRLATRFLDNVIEANKYPLPEIDKMTRANRKIGLGVMGWADLLILLGLGYNTTEAVKLGEKVMAFINDKSHDESFNLARERG
ncbi:MAG: adenosylcobalamin-dependent ribonucleoside-diphosphate reductase, partial [Desulfuromonadales bacterium]|nr:adenosylcobalamin-dependent ribonucleoside-diphosphate reductase [Desulfuromonadales bacterium]